MYKKCFFGLLSVLCLLLFFGISAYAAEPPKDISAKAYVLMAADTREVLCAYNEDEKLPMASTTKIMTSLIALEQGIPEQQIKVSSDMVAVEGTSIGLLPDDLITVRTLVYGMLLESGNDAANVTAYAVAGGQTQFLDLMNQKAKEIGMFNTCFETVSGLDSENHYSTAYDMALLGSYAIQNPEFLKICSTKTARVSYGNPPYARTFENHNKMLSYYDGAIGIKTGFTKKSGRCLVSAATRNGVTLVAVTLNAPNDWSDHQKLFDYGFSVISLRDLSEETKNISVKVVGGDCAEVAVQLSQQAVIPLVDTNVQIITQVYLQPFLYAPIAAGDCVGTVVYSIDGKTVCSRSLVAADSVAAVTVERQETEEDPTLFTRIKSFFKK